MMQIGEMIGGWVLRVKSMLLRDSI